MHSLTYARPDLSLFESRESREALVKYVCRLMQIAEICSIPHLVFGSARARTIGNRNKEECFRIMVDTFGRIAQYGSRHGTHVLIEPLSRQETDCITNADEAMELVSQVSHPHCALHIDLKSSFAEKEDLERVWTNYIQYIRHCHVANPGLLPPGPDCPFHNIASTAIRKAGYAGYISLEIAPVDDPAVLRKALRFVRCCYIRDRREGENDEHR